MPDDDIKVIGSTTDDGGSADPDDLSILEDGSGGDEEEPEDNIEEEGSEEEEDVEVHTEEDEDEEGTEDEEKEEEEEGGDREGKEEEEAPEEEPDDGQKYKGVTFRDVKAKFPNFFKEFPQFKGVLAREQQFSKLFPTPRDAEYVLTSANNFSQFQAAVENSDAKFILSEIRKADEYSSREFFLNILPAMRDVDKTLYGEAIKPILVNLVRAAQENGSDDNLAKAGKVISKFLFGSYDPPSTEISPEIRAEKERLQKERQRDQNAVYHRFEVDVNTMAIDRLNKLISRELDPNDKLASLVRKAAVDSASEDVNSRLAKDQSYLNSMGLLWQSAKRAGFNEESKTRLVERFLGRATPFIRSAVVKARKEAGLPTGKANGKPPNKAKVSPTKKRVEGSRIIKGTLDPSIIDYSKTSDADILAGKIHVKRGA